MLSIIVAFDKNHGIGFKNKLPWRITEDLNLFKNNTLDHKIIMGRKTFESLPGKLNRREIYVLTKNSLKDVKTVASVKEVLNLFQESSEEVFVAGGASVYQQLLPHCKYLYISYIKGEYLVDTYFPKIDYNQYELIEEKEYLEFVFKKFRKKEKMIQEKMLDKYAKLAVEVGANVQEGQHVVISAAIESAYFVRKVVKEAYAKKAGLVHILWSDEAITLENLKHADLNELTEAPEWKILKNKYFIDKKVCRIVIISETPGALAQIEPKVLKEVAVSNNKINKEMREYTMGNRGQWTLVALPTMAWAQKMLPNLDPEVAFEKLSSAIFSATRIEEDNDPVLAWEKHNQALSARNQILNDYRFKELHFTNDLGTDLIVGLADNHCWSGGSEISTTGVEFNPNLPTEENFCMPHKHRVSGKVFTTKPLDYQGKIIEDIMLEFKDGKVINYQAKTSEEVLKNLLETDAGSKHLGEIALVPHSSPIQQSGLLFLNTLFDENASCHFALGRAYPMNINGGTEMSLKELESFGFNNSDIHVDLMFGSECLSVIGITESGQKIDIIKKGNFVI